MAYSTIKFYKNDFPSEVNTYVDNLDSYLATKTALTFSNYQYIKHGLQVNVKIVKDQQYIDNFDYNYCTIQNSDDNIIFYYFIANVDWKSTEVLDITLKMDSVNSLGQGAAALGNPRNFTSETEIMREHEDRVKAIGDWNPGTGGDLAKIVDKNSEGIVPTKYKVNDDKLTISGSDFDWYLIYESDASDAIKTKLCASSAIKVFESAAAPESTKTFNADQWYAAYGYDYCYFLWDDNINGAFTFNNSVGGNKAITLGSNFTRTLPDGTTSILQITGACIRVVEDEGDKVFSIGFRYGYVAGLDYKTRYKYNLYNFDYVNNLGFYNFDNAIPEDHKKSVDGIYVNQITFTFSNIIRRDSDGTYENVPQRKSIVTGLPATTLLVGTGHEFRLSTIDDVDRTNSKLVKIIKYPYCPISFTKDSDGVYSFDSNWTFDGTMMVYSQNNLPTLGQNNFITYNISDDLVYHLGASDIGAFKSKINDLESKTMNSDFFTKKLIYDSFASEIKYENLYLSSTSPTLRVDFKPTGTINSKFGFRWKIPGAQGEYLSEEDFSGILLASRNNEETILNSEYINYIKTGFNYDKKQNALAIEQAQKSATIGTAGSVISLAAAAISALAGGPIGGAAAIGLGASAITSGISAFNSWDNVEKTKEKQETAMQQKLAQLAAQSASTSGTDDVDLMSWYSGNRLHFVDYSISDFMKSKIIKLLDYTGYAHETIAQPNVDSRIWYNYIQCNPHINFEGSCKLKEEWLTDLKEKYKNGVTIFHRRGLGTAGDPYVWLFDRNYENFEKWILGE